MASRAAAEKWLGQLTHLPTASGREEAVVNWVEAWVARRDDLRLQRDSGGNLLITQKGRKRRPLILAVAHMDHPAFVIGEVDGKQARFEFRGGVNPEYFPDARVEVVSRPNGGTGRVESYDPKTGRGVIRIIRDIEAGDIAIWRMRKPRQRKGIFAAPGVDDLAGCAASLAALDKTRGKPEFRHFGLLLTRAEEVGLVGSLHAAKHQTVPIDARIVNIETSRALPNARIGDGPVIRTGDHTSVFDRDMINRITAAARATGMKHQRKLMDGGGCEATAFGGFGYRSVGLCVPLGFHHNRGNIDDFEKGLADPIPMYEEISIDDFHGLIDLIVLAATALDQPDPLQGRLDGLYESQAHYLGLD